jgi:hypothetical protein
MNSVRVCDSAALASLRASEYWLKPDLRPATLTPLVGETKINIFRNQNSIPLWVEYSEFRIQNSDSCFINIV